VTQSRPPSPSATVLLAGAALAVGAFAGAASAATKVCGTLRLAQEWTAKGSPYVVTGDVFLPNTSRLRIGPGVTVKFARPGASGAPCDAEDPAPPPADWADSTYAGMRIEGPFRVIGTEEAPVVFEPESPDSATVGWDGLRFLGHDPRNAEIGFAVFRGANQAVQVRKGGFFIHHTLFEGNNTGLALGPRGDVSVINCAFLRNRSAGISIEKARPRVTGSLFADNGGYGVLGDGRTGPSLAYNAFWRNREGHCHDCLHTVLARDTAADDHGNKVADPVFVDSESHKAAIRADVTADTPPHLVKDKAIAGMEAESRKKWAREEKAFKPLGKGPYRLSRYSGLIDAGPPGDAFKDRDGSRNDIGLHGGPMERIKLDPF
jgi:hypothetical protein